MRADEIQGQDRFLTLAEVRGMLNVSRATLWRWTAEHGLRVVRVGGVTRIRECDLQAFIKRHETGDAAVTPARIENGA